MKTFLKCPVLLFALLFSIGLNAQQLPFLNDDDVNTSHFYFPNNGQVADFEGALQSQILYHTEFTFPKYYFHDNKISFVSMIVDSISPDTVYRIDMEFYQPAPPTPPTESTPNLVAQDQKDIRMNYYLPHCGNGIENVPGYERLIYQNAYNDIDVEITSNASGLKARFIVYPGGNPNDILLKFTGQDCVLTPANGNLKIYLDQWDMDLRSAYAYQINSNNQPYLLSWLPMWNHNGNGIVAVTTYGYNAAEPLIIELAGPGSATTTASSITGLNWSTYYGGIGQDENVGFDTDLFNNLYTLTNVKGSGPSFPPINGVVYPNNISYNIMLSRFENNEQKYATYYGGSNDDIGRDITFHDVPDGVGNIFIGGYTESTGIEFVSTSSYFNQTKQAGVDGLILKFNAAVGTKKWISYFGGNGDDYIFDIKANSLTKELFICGTTTSTNTGGCDGSTNGFPICNSINTGFYQTTNQGGFDAFVAQINTDYNTTDLVWSTYFGGDEDDFAYAVDFTTTNFITELYVAGRTESNLVASSFGSPVSANTNGHFPLANPGSGAYFQSQLGSISSPTAAQDGFIAKFNPQRQCVWNTFYGGDKWDQITDISVNANGIFAVGNTSSTTSSSGNCSVNTGGNLPKCSSTSNGYIATDAGQLSIFMTQFSTLGNLLWATCYSSNGIEGSYGYVDCETDALGNVYITTNSYPQNSSSTHISTLAYTGQYYQHDNSHITEGGQGSDNILLMFNSDYERIWATYFGGGCNGCQNTSTANSQGDEYAQAIAVFGSEWLYFGGYTKSLETPTEDPGYPAYFDSIQGSVSANMRANDGYITRMYIANIALFLEELTQNGTIQYVKGYPNPTSDFVNIILPLEKSSQAKTIIYNNLGQEIQTLDTFTDTGDLKLNVTSLKNGLYFVKIIIENESYVYSFIKQ